MPVWVMGKFAAACVGIMLGVVACTAADTSPLSPTPATTPAPAPAATQQPLPTANSDCPGGVAVSDADASADRHSNRYREAGAVDGR